MLYEDDVVDAVCIDLDRRGWQIEQRLTPTQQGIDVIASRAGTRLCIEAKGETSGKDHTARYGKPFDSKQINSHVSRAFYAAATAMSAGNVGAIALPDSAGHQACVAKIAPALERLGIPVGWVSPGGTVRWEPHLPD